MFRMETGKDIWLDDRDRQKSRNVDEEAYRARFIMRIV